MTRLTAKLITLTILERWKKKTLWMVKTVVNVGLTSCRWFKSEKKAREYATLLQNADVVRLSYPSDDYPTLSDDYTAPTVEVLGEQA